MVRRRTDGFTVMEMMVVMLIIGVVLILTFPNIQQKREIINAKGCESLGEVVNSQILMYEIDHDTKDVSMDDLVHGGYLKESQRSCPGGKTIYIENGEAHAD